MIAILLGILLMVLGIAQTSGFKDALKVRTVTYLQETLGVDAQIGQLDIDYFDQFTLKGLYIPDLHADTLIYIATLSVDFDLNQLSKGGRLNQVIIDKGVINLGTYASEESLNIQFLVDAFSPEKNTIKSSASPFVIDHITLHETSFRYFNAPTGIPSSIRFDENNIRFSAIEGEFDNLEIIGDSLHFHIASLATQERSGLSVQHLSSTATISATQLRFDNLDLQTLKSSIKTDLHFGYPDYDFSDFVDRVNIQAQFDSSVVDPSDIAFFSPSLDSYHTPFLLNGNIEGYINDFRSEDFQFSTIDTRFDGQIHIQRLTHLDRMQLDIKPKTLQTTPIDIERLAHLSLPLWVKPIQTIEFDGRIHGGLEQFNLNGSFQTNLGSIQSELQISDINGAMPHFAGSFQSEAFAIKELLSDESLDIMSADITFNGYGKTFPTLNLAFNGNIHETSYHGIRYEHIHFIGSMVDQELNTTVTSNLDHQSFKVTSLFDWTNEAPEFKLTSTIDHLTFKLHPEDTNQRAIGMEGSMKMVGLSLNEFEAKMDFAHISYTQNGVAYPLKNIKINKKFAADYSSISVITDEIEAELKGDYILSEIPQIAQQIVQLVDYSADISQHNIEKSHAIEFKGQLKNNPKILELISPDVSIDKAAIQLYYNIDQNRLRSSQNLVNLRVNNLSAPHVTSRVQNGDDTSSIDFSISTDGILQNDSNLFDVFEFTGSLKNQVLYFHNRSQKKEDLSITVNGRAAYEHDSIKIFFDQSSVMLNHKQWTLRPTGSPNVVLHHGITEFLYFDFRYQDEILFVDASMGKRANKINAIVSNFKLSNINPFITGYNLHFNGVVDGYIDVSDREGFPIIETDLFIDRFQMDEDTLGDLQLSSQSTSGLAVSIDGRISDGVLNEMMINGEIDFDQQQSPLNLHLKTKKSSIKPFEKYLEGLMSNLTGYSSTDISISGPLRNPRLAGTMQIDSLQFVLDYLQTQYSGAATLDINYTSFNIAKAELYDRFGHSANLSGFINHRNFHDFDIDIAVDSLQNFEIMNTQKGDNSLFYGPAYIDGSAQITGPIEDILITVNAKSRKGTIIQIPLENEASDHSLSYVKFVDLADKTKSPLKTSSDVKMDFNFEITNDAEVQLIFDELLGDKIEASGHGNIRMEINTFGDFNMYGGLTIDRGNYLFTAFDLINKFFVVKPGGTLLWDGNPYNAKINLEAIKREYPTPLPLMQGLITSSQDSTAFETAIATDCYLKLAGLLFNPDVTFDLQFPSQSNINSNINSSLNTVINRIRLDEEELNRQVFALLVLGTFIPPSFANNTGPNLSVGAVNTGINSFSDFASSQINNWLGQLDTRFQLGVDYQTSYQQKAELILSLRRKFLNDRLELSYSTDAAAQGSIPYDISVKYNVSEDGNFKIQGSQKQATDPTLGNIANVRTTGIGLFYRYQFDRFRLRRRKKKSIESQ